MTTYLTGFPSEKERIRGPIPWVTFVAFSTESSLSRQSKFNHQLLRVYCSDGGSEDELYYFLLSDGPRIAHIAGRKKHNVSGFDVGAISCFELNDFMF